MAEFSIIDEWVGLSLPFEFAPKRTPDRLYLSPLSGLPEVRPVYDLLASTSGNLKWSLRGPRGVEAIDQSVSSDSPILKLVAGDYTLSFAAPFGQVPVADTLLHFMLMTLPFRNRRWIGRRCGRRFTIRYPGTLFIWGMASQPELG